MVWFPVQLMALDLFSAHGKKDGSVALFCFSPPVILITFTIEAALAIYAWWRYHSSRFGRLSSALLFTLSLFQISEWFICRGGSAVLWSRVGFVATAFLPVMGLDLIAMLTKRKWPTWLGYGLVAAFSAVFVFLPDAFTGAACTGKFVVFNGGSLLLDILYGSYYFLTTLLGIVWCIIDLCRRTLNRRAISWLLAGYLAFCLPVLAIYIFILVNRAGFASILCGFAVLFALALALKVLPAVEKV